MRHLALCQAQLGKKKEHELATLKRIDFGALRMGEGDASEPYEEVVFLRGQSIYVHICQGEKRDPPPHSFISEIAAMPQWDNSLSILGSKCP